MSKLNSLDDLYVHELQDLYSAENQILKALPKMAEAASSPELKTAFQEHMKQTEGQVQRLDQIFEKLGRAKHGKKCAAMEGLVKEGEEVLKEEADPDVRDAALIAAAQRVEHYEIAGYGTARTFACMLGDQEAQQLLQATLDEEALTDEKLTKIAMSRVNEQAMA
jgi:ferritin-like metal-binding protein YciE